MPKVIVKASTGPDVPGRWALGTGPRPKFNGDGSPARDQNGNQTYWPARSGVFIPAGQDTELTITDEELRDLQTGANASLFIVVVTDAGAQPDINEGGSSMANQPINRPPNQPAAPGTTVPPGTAPQPTSPPPGTTTPPAPTPTAPTTTPTTTPKR